MGTAHLRLGLAQPLFGILCVAVIVVEILVSELALNHPRCESLRHGDHMFLSNYMNIHDLMQFSD